MKDKSATGRHAAPQEQPPVKKLKIVRVRDEEQPEKPSSKRRRKTVLGGLAFVAVILMIFGLALQGAVEERRYEEHLRMAQESYSNMDYDTALGHLRKAAEREETPEIRMMMVDCYEAMGSEALEQGNTDRATVNFDKALELLRGMDLQDETIRARIDTLENAKDQLRQAGKIYIAGMEFERSASSLIIRRTPLSEQDLAHVADLYSLYSLSLTEDGLSDVSALSGLGGLTMLDLSGNDISDLGPLAGFSGLRTLYLDNNPITDFSPLYQLTELSMLSIREIDISEEQLTLLTEALPNCAIHSETAVAEVRELTLGGLTFREDVTELDLSGRQLSDLSALSVCRQLVRLNLSGNAISDLSPLMDLPYLEELDISNNQVSDLRPLMALKSLQKVNAAQNSIENTAPLGYLTELLELDLSGNELRDLSGLASLGRLETLNLENTWLHDDYLSALGGLQSLIELNLKENPELTGDAVDALKRSLPNCYFEHSRLVYTVELHGERYRKDLTVLDLSGIGEPFDLSDIAMIPALEKLNLSGNRLEFIYELRPLENLRELDLSNNQISDLTPLAYMRNLEKLNLANNRVNSVTALLNLTQLKELDISNNDLTAAQIERLERTLPDCKILHD